MAAKFINAHFNVAVRLPTVAQGFIHANITPMVLATPRLLWATIKAILHGQTPTCGNFKITVNNPLTLDVEGFRKQYEQHVADQVYRLHKALLRRDYLGKHVAEPSQFQASLSAVRQLKIDPETGRPVLRSVEDYHIEFTEVLTTWDPATPMPMDPVQLFWINLHQNILDKARADNYQPPAMEPPEQYQDMLNRLREVKEKADEFSLKILEVQKTVQQTLGLHRGNPRTPRVSLQQPQSMLAYGYEQDYFQDQGDEYAGVSPYDNQQYTVQPRGLAFSAPVPMAPQYQAPLDIADVPYYDPYTEPPSYAAHPYAQAPGVPDLGPILAEFANKVRLHYASAATPQAHNRLAEESSAMAVAFASLAEEAIRKAIGNDRPPLECWGCSKHPDANIRRDCSHRFFDCPRKVSDPTVRELGEAKLREFMEERRARRLQSKTNAYSPANQATAASTTVAAPRDDKEAKALGHHSAATASLVRTIASPDTSAEVRSMCYQFLKSKLDDPSSTVNVAEVKRPSAPRDENPRDPKAGKPFHCHFMPFNMETTKAAVMTSVMQASSQRAHVNLEITQVLPHVRLPIGLDGKSTMFSMVDSGAGLNLGRLQYHLDLYEKHPEVVHAFTYLKDADNMSEFGLGQVGEGEGPKVIAVIEYHSPFKVDGRPVRISFGLSESCTCNTIIGFPFLKAADGIPMFGSNALILQRFGVTLNMDYQVPLRANQIAQTTPDCQAFHVLDPYLQSHVEVLKTAVIATSMANSNLKPGALGSPDFQAFLDAQGSAFHSQQE